MLRMRRCHNLRVLCYVLVLSGLLYTFLNDSISTLPTSISSRPSSKHASHPVYEYTSIYRKHANQSFEAALDAQLLALERSTRASLPSNEPNLIANLTIHQITTPKLESQLSAWVNQWRTNNPGWGYNLLTSHPLTLLSHYSGIPSILSAYEDPYLRPDLVRFLLLWYYGGFYTDINTWERVSLKDCAPIVETTQNFKNVSLMIGMDRDEPFYNRRTIEGLGWSRGYGFGLGVIWAVRRFDPVLRTAIVRSISHAKTKRESDGRMQSRDDWDLFQSDWEDWERNEISGSGMFTDIVLEALNDGLKGDHEIRDRDAGIERRVTWKKFKGLHNTLWIEPSQAKEGADIPGIAILPINVWSNGQDHSGSGTFEAEDACVNHVIPAKSRKAWYEKGLWR